MGFDIYVSFIIVTTKTHIFIMKAMSLFMDKKSAFPQRKEDTKNDGRHKKKYG